MSGQEQGKRPPARSLRAFLRWAWNPPADRMITDHPFVPLDWAPGCGHLSHPQANRCFQPRRYHTRPKTPRGGTRDERG